MPATSASESKPKRGSTPDEPRSSTTIHPVSRNDTPSTGQPSSEIERLDGPPPLGYSLYAKHRRRNIAIFWTLVVFDSVAMPIVLYFALWYHTSLSPNAVFSIVTAAIGGVSIVDYAWRLWRLIKKDSDCRVPGSKRFSFDFFHQCFTTMWTVVIVELIVGTCPTNPPIRLLAMPLASALFCFTLILAAIDYMRWRKIPSPFAISSQPKGSIPRPSIYNIIEDVVSVDGCGGVEFRARLSVRYESSHVFRRMISRVGLSWWISGLLVAVLTTVLVFTLTHDAAFVVGWSVPFVWAGIWALGTIVYVRKQLRYEAETWNKESAGVSESV